jgi:hypothetical protein
MSACSSEIDIGIAERFDAVRRARFFGIAVRKDMPGSAIAHISRTNVQADAHLARHDAMHTDPQVLFATRSSDQIMLARERRTP